MSFRIERNDITKVHTEAIVNTANYYPVIGSGTDSAVYTAAGADKLLAERKKIGEIERGEAAYTSACNLKKSNGIKYIIHTVGIRWQDGNQGEPDIIRNCYRNSLNLANKLKCKSIAIPLLATGNYGFPVDVSLSIALDEINQFLFKNDMEIVLVVYDKQSLIISSKLFSNITTYIDEHYVEEKEDINNGSEIKDYYFKRDEYLRSQNKEDHKDSSKKIKTENNSQKSINDCNTINKTDKNISVDQYLKLNDKHQTFQDLLIKFINAKGLDNPTVYKKSLIVDKKLFSKIISGHTPNKRSAMALGLALELNKEEFDEFLATANFAFNPAKKFDLIVQYCVENKIYNIVKVDLILHEYNQQPFCIIKNNKI